MPMIYADHYCNCIEDENNNYIFSGRCHVCKTPTSVTVPKQALLLYRDGAHIQHAMPMLSPGQREFLISGNCETCFDSITKEPEDDV